MKPNKHLVESPLGAEFTEKQISECQSDHNTGAIAFFLGQVRADKSNEGITTAIEYTAYEEMVEKAVSEIRLELFSKFDDLISLGIWHSTGLVKVGEISLLVLVSSGHRKQAFQALEECVELIKKNLPVWKKEIYSDGSHNWTNS